MKSAGKRNADRSRRIHESEMYDANAARRLRLASASPLGPRPSALAPRPSPLAPSPPRPRKARVYAFSPRRARFTRRGEDLTKETHAFLARVQGASI
ncbi:hypothetical protein AKJ09_05455 [Labilithrix luteola]|uniref:Uncharacterized protein n=1 Tax=Labilithrix luteola TaxID=1391654 RepID=A0A0K1PZI7_9BACT|nr:hypothetical protein AKJ09_05455 [Labilithrix luteola]